jgi:STE24 endopeptidase
LRKMQTVKCPEAQNAAVQLGAERRRIYLVGAILSLAIPLVPYLSGTWETAWYSLAATWMPLGVRTGLFIISFHLAFAVVLLPLGYYSGFVLPHAFGLSRQRPRDWWLDWMKATALGTALGVLVGGAFLWTAVEFGRAWWWVFGLMVSAGVVLLTFVAPYVLLPIFFKMRPLDDRATAERIRGLLRRAGADVREVCSLDFSRRTVEANAAVIGMGRSRRVVLADTLLSEFAPAEVDAVVAHELGHHIHRDVLRLLAGHLAVTWAGLAFAAWFAPVALPLLGLPSLGYVPGYPTLFAVAELFLLLTTPLLNGWSRRVEAAADRFALQLTRDPHAFAEAMHRLACQNLVELCPPRWAEVLLASHPALQRRIAMAEGWSV